MKSSAQFIFCILIMFRGLCLLRAADMPWPRPAFMPSTPPSTKAISAYTAADVLGVVSTRSGQLPVDHPFRSGGKYGDAIKKDWPGSKIPTQIDAMVQIILNAPAAAPERDIEMAMTNLSYILRRVFDVSPQIKADALIRIVKAQTDPLKKSRATSLAASHFGDFLDVRLLSYEKNRLDDATVVSVFRGEARPGIEITVRWGARSFILRELKQIDLTLDTSPFMTADEATGCAALKAWLTANWGLVTTKCSEALARPDRQLPDISVSVWDVRW